MNPSVPDENAASARLGRLVAEQLGDGPSAQRLAHQREALAALAHRRSARRSRAWVAAAAVLSAASVAAIWSASSTPEAPKVGREHFVGVAPMLGAAIGDRRLQEQEWFGAASAVTVQFSDSSVVTLEPSARVRLSKLRRDAVQLNVESGGLRAALAESRAQPWSVLAGPFRVEVEATHFALRWEAEQGQLWLRVERGELWVSGGQLGEQAHRVGPGEFEVPQAEEDSAPQLAALQLMPAAKPVTGASVASAPSLLQSDPPAPIVKRPRPPGAAPGAPSADHSTAAVHAGSSLLESPQGQASDETPAAGLEGAAVGERREQSNPGGAPPEHWQELAEQGRYSDAITVAQAAGFERILRRGTASELMLLADAARLSGAATQARSALLEVRRRFPERAGLAAYSLGRLAFDVQRDPSEALRWFEVYLSGAPTGPMAQGARARRLQAALQLGDANRVQRAADDYLEHHPDGALAERARAALGNSR